MKLVHKTIGECLEERRIETPYRTAIEYEDVSYTWSELDLLTDYMAIRMNLYGVEKGDHAGIWCVNNPNWVITYLALTKLGAVPVLINTCYQEQELVTIIRYADIQYLYYGDVYKQLVYSKIIEQAKVLLEGKVKKWIPIGKDQDGRWFHTDSFFYSERTKKEIVKLKKLKQQVKPEEVTSMLFTSGTTSVPKGVLLTHVNLLNAAQATILSMRWTAEDNLCVAVPLFHCFGITSSLLTSILAGCEMCLLPCYRTIDVLNCIETYGCTVLNGVPSMFLALIRNSKFEEYSLSSLKTGIIAGSPISCEEYHSICIRIPGMKLQPSYGQTETSPAVTFADMEDSFQMKSRSVGKAIPLISIRIADVNDGTDLEAGKVGEIQVKGYNVMKGYYRLPKETQAAIEPSGWLHTGDLGYLDREGNLYITGRIKEMIIRAGENIAPREIEECLKQLPFIEQVKVIGIPAEVIQEEVIACVVLAPDSTFDEQSIRDFIMSKLAHYKVPSRILQFKKMPMSSTGKILIQELKRQVGSVK